LARAARQRTVEAEQTQNTAEKLMPLPDFLLNQSDHPDKTQVECPNVPPGWSDPSKAEVAASVHP